MFRRFQFLYEFRIKTYEIGDSVTPQRRRVFPSCERRECNPNGRVQYSPTTVVFAEIIFVDGVRFKKILNQKEIEKEILRWYRKMEHDRGVLYCNGAHDFSLENAHLWITPVHEIFVDSPRTAKFHSHESISLLRLPKTQLFQLPVFAVHSRIIQWPGEISDPERRWKYCSDT